MREGVLRIHADARLEGVGRETKHMLAGWVAKSIGVGHGLKRDRRGGEPSDELLKAFQELRNEARVALNVDRDQEIAHAKS